MYQKFNSFCTVSSNLPFAKKFFSSSILNGMGVSSEAQRITGASNNSKQFSADPGCYLTTNATSQCIFMQYQYSSGSLYCFSYGYDNQAAVRSSGQEYQWKFQDVSAA